MGELMMLSNTERIMRIHFHSWRSSFSYVKEKRRVFADHILRVKRKLGRGLARHFIEENKTLGFYPYRHMLDWSKKMKIFAVKDTSKRMTEKVVNILRGCDFAVHWLDMTDLNSTQMIGYSNEIIHFVQTVSVWSTKQGKMVPVDELTEIPIKDFFIGDYDHSIAVQPELYDEAAELIKTFIINEINKTKGQISNMMK